MHALLVWQCNRVSRGPPLTEISYTSEISRNLSRNPEIFVEIKKSFLKSLKSFVKSPLKSRDGRDYYVAHTHYSEKLRLRRVPIQLVDLCTLGNAYCSMAHACNGDFKPT